MNVSISKKPKSLVSLTVEVPWEKAMEYVKRAAKEFSQTHAVAGFRKGAVPYEVVEKKLGLPALLELASEMLVAHTYFQALKQHGLEAIGTPKVSILARTPGGSFRYEAEASVIPEATLPEFKDIELARKPVEIGEEEVEKLVDELRWMRATEREAAEPAAQGSKVTITYNLSQAGVPLEGGSAMDTSVVLGRTQVLPEFSQAIEGMKAGEQKKFKVKFPDTWSRSDLAGRTVDVDLAVKSVAHIDLPAVDDAFAASLGKFATTAEFKDKLKANLKEEKDAEEERRLSAEAVKIVAEKTKFSDFPDVLIESETQQIMGEIGARLQESGITLAAWLERMKKTEESLRQEMKPQAIERVKAMLVLRSVARQQDIGAEDQEVLEEIEKILAQAQGNPQIQERIRSHEYHDYLKNQIAMRKTVEWLKKKIVKGVS